MIYSFKDKHPKIDESVYIAPGVKIIGDVRIDEQATVWFNTVIRGDNSHVIIGARTNVQDGSVLHVNKSMPLVIEEDVSIGHNVIVHACTVRKGALLGMGAIVLDKADIGEYAVVGAGTVVPPGKTVPPRTLVVGNPMRIVRELSEEEVNNMNTRISFSYVEKGSEFKEYLTEIERK
ncbi:gamma carbonic anhydrase family protein [Bacillus sp. PS06]|uniref:gamma carbonic anhydrase family protein n=1 Tax=Bacillus sp. PS06 TaxID=2764176 RepID=UPI00177F4ED3|nr:gamma carbonic anhydrase family protein [Bacillus sp. PS06]MBD8067933.1 gamma carbonic anhydrase family protein [Bacillus sp. PS06]